MDARDFRNALIGAREDMYIQEDEEDHMVPPTHPDTSISKYLRRLRDQLDPDNPMMAEGVRMALKELYNG